jgi:crotonobetainyl-CoA:carnitine CoA-transferase CaiB-like acyl-CoA transferase
VLLEAHAGLMNCTGPRNGDPVKVGAAMTDILTGLHGPRETCVRVRMCY